MKLALLATTAFALLATPVSAATVLTFGQVSGLNTITATPNIADTATTISGSNVAVTITQDLGGFLGPAILNLSATSIDAAVAVGTSVLQHFSGSWQITSGPGGTGINYLSGTFTDAAFGTGPSLTLSVGAPPDSITTTSDQVPAIDLGLPEAISLSFTNVIPPVAIVGSTLAGFNASIAGNFSSTPVSAPEPATLGLLGLGLLGLGIVRARHRGGEN
jgi:PEP-CTERM motif